MAWMTRNPTSIVFLTALFLSIGLTGCGPDAMQKKIDQLNAENDGLKQEIENRDRQLNDAMVRENDSKSTIDELNQQLARARADGKNSEGWITMPNFDMISVPGSVLFEAGKADLTSGGKAKLAQIASDIRAKYSDRDIFVFGHTDDQPIRKSKWKDNWELGANRSLKVIRTLSELGIPNDSLVQANCAQYRPKTANTNEKARLQNRRVEFYAVHKNAGAIDSTSARGISDE